MEIVQPGGIPSHEGHLKAKRNLIPLVGGQAVSLFGDYIAFFTLPLFVLSLTGDAFDLGLTAAAETLPMLLFGLAAGVFLENSRDLGSVSLISQTQCCQQHQMLELSESSFSCQGCPPPQSRFKRR